MEGMYAEGLAKVGSGKAFINPLAKLNRDMGIAIVGPKTNGGGLKMLDATAATGIRGIRYLMESAVGDCTFLEINEDVFGQLEANIKSNSVKATALNTSIQEFCSSTRERFDLVELDPFGGIYPYVFDVAKVLRGGSYFFATATDTAVLCGAQKNACLKLYSAKPMHNKLCHETGLRIMIGYMARTLAQFNFGIDVLLGMFHDHYMRVYAKLTSGAAAATRSIDSLGFAFHCDSCGAIASSKGLVPVQTKCEACGSKMRASGPLWLGKLKDKGAIDAISAYSSRSGDRRLQSVSQLLSSELDIPLFYHIPSFTKRLGITGVSPDAVIESLKNSGFAASHTHFDPNGVKSDAPSDSVAEAIRDVASGKVSALHYGQV